MNEYGYDGELGRFLEFWGSSGGFALSAATVYLQPSSALVWTVSNRDIIFHTSCAFAKAMTKIIDCQWLLLPLCGSSLFIYTASHHPLSRRMFNNGNCHKY